MNFLKYNIKNEKNLLKFLNNNMHYGFVYRNKIYVQDENFGKNMDKFYKMRLKDNLIKSKYGVCWDFCEFEREFFDSQNIECNCYFIESFKNDIFGPTHSFCIYKINGYYFWFEFAWEKYQGIHKYDTLNSALKDIRQKFENFYNNKYQIVFHKLSKIYKRLNSKEYIDFALSSPTVRIDEK